MTHSILTCSPYFVDAALNELHRYHPQLTVLQTLAPGILYLEAPCAFDALTQPWRHRLPIYLHHLFPVHAVLDLHNNAYDLKQIQNAVRRLAPADAVIQIRSTLEQGVAYSVADLHAALYSPSLPLEMPTGRLVSIVIAREENCLKAYVGISWTTQNLSPWAGGQIPIIQSVPNRAGYKLLEALDCFAIRLSKGDHALDLGAAPGAWTTLLRERGLRVTAVAPTAMYPWLAIDGEVSYQSMLAEDYLTRCKMTFDLIVNDMKLDAQDSAHLMVNYAGHLRQEGIAIMTLKIRERNRMRVIDHSLRILRKAYKIIRVRQLVSNRNEVTLFLRRKPATAPQAHKPGTINAHIDAEP